MAMLLPFSSVWPSFVFVMPCGVTSLRGLVVVSRCADKTTHYSVTSFSTMSAVSKAHIHSHRCDTH